MLVFDRLKLQQEAAEASWATALSSARTNAKRDACKLRNVDRGNTGEQKAAGTSNSGFVLLWVFWAIGCQCDATCVAIQTRLAARLSTPRWL